MKENDFFLLNTFFSTFKESNEPLVLGIDEAGRGPAVGPMVYAIYAMKPGERNKRIFNDSKMYSEKDRNRLFEILSNDFYAYIIIDPMYITINMNRKILNLNQIARLAVINLIKHVQEKCINIQKIYIDGLGNNTKYKEFLENNFKLSFVVENKADVKYEVVSGASIVAKVTRDEFFKKESYSNFYLENEYSSFVKGSCNDCGSGYPSDPNVKKWLKNNFHPFFGFPPFVRHSWKTIFTFFEKNNKKRFKSNKNFYW
ncbi:RNASEH2A [Ecytonucleospora hepatopenaei]|uniref:Ribonuclease n=1 Tax=Ecytonucleospora hepatopenaei TaxID=646526 RepID=A0A1W0E6N6_9MICR|nr:RNASEH2A [Ecytonucleospora hepatopenaei]